MPPGLRKGARDECLETCVIDAVTQQIRIENRIHTEARPLPRARHLVDDAYFEVLRAITQQQLTQVKLEIIRNAARAYRDRRTGQMACIARAKGVRTAKSVNLVALT
jgi:hypothetical protein